MWVPIIDDLESIEEISFKELMNELKVKLEGMFHGSVSWYITTVKLDLEARQVIDWVTAGTPQIIRLMKGRGA